MQFSNDGASFSSPEGYASTKSWQLPGENGTKIVYVKFKDGAGIWSGGFSDTIILDTTPPETSITSKPTGCIVENIVGTEAAKTAKFTFGRTDNFTSPENLLYSYRLDSGVWSDWSLSSTVTYTGLTDGVHTFEVKSRDQAGNEDPSPARYEWTIDTVPPSPPAITSAGNGSRVYTGDFETYIFTHWDISGTTPSDTYTLWVNGSQDKVNYASYNTTWSYSADNLTVGAVNTYTAVAQDLACNNSAPGVINITIPDADKDRIGDLWEKIYGLDPNNKNDASLDPDRDGLLNLEEYLTMGVNGNTTNPRLWDTDKDGMPDGWEVKHGLNPLANDAAGDPDSDGLNNLGEYLHNADPNNPDPDKDGMPDGWEVEYGLRPDDPSDAGTDKDGDLYTNLDEYLDGSDPVNPNSFFGRMVSASYEIWSDILSEGGRGTGSASYSMDSVIGGGISGLSADSNYLISSGFFFHETAIDPNNPDLDNDGMPDHWEILHSVTDPYADTDHDGLTNIEEYRNHTDPNNRDTDNDRMPDEWEVTYGLNPNDPADAGVDTDGDGYSNIEEYNYGRNPNDPYDLPARMSSANYNMTADVMSQGGGETDPTVNYKMIGVIGQGVTGISSSPDNIISSGFFIQYSVADPNVSDGVTDPDKDRDGMPDVWEKIYGVDDPSADPDEDGLSNIAEYQNNTDPTNSDTDNDLMPDGWEVVYLLNPTDNTDAYRDTDLDGYTNYEEYLYNRNPQDPNSKPGILNSSSYNITSSSLVQGGSEIIGSGSYNMVSLLGQGVTGIATRSGKVLSAGFFTWDSVGPVADPDLSKAEVKPQGILADGVSVATITVIPKDGAGTQLGGGQQITITTTEGQMIGEITYTGDGRYTQKIQATTQESAPILTIMVNDTQLTAHPALIFLNPSGDYDGDGLSNTSEINTYLTDPLYDDSDNDRMKDGWEITYKLNPNLDDSQSDADGDYISNLQEYIDGTDPLDHFSRLPEKILDSGMATLPDIAVDRYGDKHIVWEDQGDNNQEILYKKTQNGGWSEVQNISDTSGYSFNPHIEADDSGNVHVVWEDATTENFEIYYKKYNGTWSETQNISETTGYSFNPEISVDNMGNISIVWQEYIQDNFEIYYRRFDGNTWSERINISETTGHSMTPHITADKDRNLHVVWAEEVSDGWEIYYKKYNGISWTTAESISEKGRFSFDPDIVTDSKGNPHIIWESLASGDYEVYYRRYEDGIWQATENISDNEGYSGSGKISIDSSDHLHIAWMDDSTGNWEIYYTESDGSSWDMPKNISNTSGESLYPAMTGDSQGNMHLVWQDEKEEGSDILYNFIVHKENGVITGTFDTTAGNK